MSGEKNHLKSQSLNLEMAQDLYRDCYMKDRSRYAKVFNIEWRLRNGKQGGACWLKRSEFNRRVFINE